MNNEQYREQIELLKAALEAMHDSVKGKENEMHITMSSFPPTNGCYIYIERFISDIKNSVLKKLEAMND